MNDRDMPGFYAGLNEMGAMFCDEVLEVRQRLYWEFFRDGHTLEEWQYACNQAMWRESFHKVPMPVVLREYIVEFRKASAEELRQRELRRPVLPLAEQAFALDQIRAIQTTLFKDDRLAAPVPLYDTEAEGV